MAIKLKRLLVETDEFDDRALEDLEGLEAIVMIDNVKIVPV